MAAAANLFVRIGADISELQKKMSEAGSTIEQSGQKMRSLGLSLTASVTAPIVGIGVAAFKASTDFNEAMANVASLIPGQKDRIDDLKGSVQDMAIEFGKSTQDLAGGLYQVISAFGDSAESVKILEINTQAAAAGISSIEEAVALTSAITKAYGDTSADAVQKVSDLALQTVVLGQTTFPELANAMGRVTPIAEALGVTQEELFGSMATLTGVTGSTAEVSTQLRAAFQAIIKPTADMAMAMTGVVGQLVEQGKITGPVAEEYKTLQRNALEMSQAMLAAQDAGDTKTYKELEQALKDNNKAQQELVAGMGPTIVETMGLQGAMNALAGTADGNTNTLGKMFGSVEAINAVLALTGPQADTWNQKVAAMADVTGATTAAFEEQAKGINEAGFTWEQLKQKFIVVAQKLGDALIPGLLALMDAAQPLIGIVTKLVEWFAAMPEPLQKIVVGVAAVAAGIGPAMTVFGQFQTTLGKVIGVLGSGKGLGGVLSGIPDLISKVGSGFASVGSKLMSVIGAAGPWGLAIAGIVAGVALIITNWDAIAGFFEGLWNGITDVAKAAWDGIKGFLTEVWNGIASVASTIWNGISNFFSGVWDGIKKVASAAWDGIKFMLTASWEDVIEGGKSLWSGLTGFFGGLWDGIKNTAAAAWDEITGLLGKAWQGIKDMASGIWNGIAGFFGGIWDGITGKTKKAAEETTTIMAEMSDDLVGNSIIPDMVQGIGSWMDRLKDAMPSRARVAIKGTLDEFAPMLRLPDWQTPAFALDTASGVAAGKMTVNNYISGNYIKEDYDVERIGDLLVKRLYRAGVAK